VYKRKNNEQQALEYAYKSLHEYEVLKSDSGIMESHHEIGVSMRETKSYQTAISHLYKSLTIAQKIQDIEMLGDNHSAIGTTFKDLTKTDSSLFHHQLALEYRIKLGNKKHLAATYNDIGLAYKKKKDLKTALEYLFKALEMRELQKDTRGIAGACINIGNTLKQNKQFKEAQIYYNRGINIAKENGHFDFYLNGLSGRANNSIKLNDYKLAAMDYDFYVEKKDSIYKVNLNSQISEMDAKYQSDKKDAELKLQEEQLAHQAEQNNKQKTIITLTFTALFISLAGVILVYRSYKLNKRNAHLLSVKNQLIEEKNREITDSINYAKLIQQSLLASKEMLDINLESYFILYKPKDIVSGDFYWAHESVNGFLIAAVDCTGHGVPGAFMSLIGKENLDKAVSKTNRPGEILSELNKNVKKSLQQNNESASRDGMDAVIVKVGKKQNDSYNISYAGANRPLYIIRNETNSLEELKPTKQAIGGFTQYDQEFTEHLIQAKAGDTLILGTDGFADQFGSSTNKKLTTKRFKTFLQTIGNHNSSEQKKQLENYFHNWKGNQEQLDDILVIGLKL
jgi:serine phosphatase RsbU (regulator of sigma subunit)